MSERAPRPTRSDYVRWQTMTTRWADVDVYGHLNNARYLELVDTAVNAHLAEATGTDVRALPAIGVVAEVGCRYFREVDYPEPVEIGLAVERIGRSSVSYRVGIFQGGTGASDDPAAAEAWFVHVYVTSERVDGQRAATPVPDLVRAAVEPLVRP